jgi:signal transduction histidine kinase
MMSSFKIRISTFALLVAIVIIPTIALAETAYIDSLQQELKDSENEEKYEIMHDLGWAYRETSTEQALKYEQQAIDLAREGGDSLKVARSLYHLARINAKFNCKLAVEFSDKSIKLIKDLDESNIAKYYRNLGIIYEKNFQYIEAIEAYNYAYDYAVRFSEEEYIALLLEDLSDVYSDIGEYKTALKKSEVRLRIWESLKNEFEIVNTYLDIGRYYWSISDYNNVKKYFDLSLMKLEILEQKTGNKYDYEKAILYLNNANLNIVVSKYNFAIINLVKAIQFIELSEREALYSSVYNLIGKIYHYFGKHKEAYLFGFKALNINILDQNLIKVGQSISGLGQYLFEMNKCDLSLQCLNIAINIFEDRKQYWDLAVSNNYLGECHKKIGNYIESIQSHKKAYIQKMKFGDRRGIAFSLKLLGATYLDMRQFHESKGYLVEALILAEEINDKELTRDIFKLLSSVSEFEKSHLDAIEYLLKYDTINEDIFSSEKLSAISQMDVEIRALENQKELDLLERENILISADLEREKLIRLKLMILLGGLFLFVVSLVLYYRSIKRSNFRLAGEISTRIESESELKKLKSDLKQLVVDRTAELQQVNEDLQDKIAEKKRSRKLLIEAEKMAGIGELAAGVAHEIRNPIAIIRSTAQYLTENYPLTDKLMKILIKSSDDINRIISRLMKFARLKTRELKKVNLIAFLKDSLIQFDQEIQRKKINLNLSELSREFYIDIDTELFDDLLANLISNSIEELPEEGGRINIRFKNGIDSLEMSIEDNGSGINDANTALKSFFTSKKDHVGLGLNFVQYISRIHGYTFRLTSNGIIGTKAIILFK